MKLPDWVLVTANFLRKVWFPSHHRKITRTVIAVGAALLLDGYFLDGLLQWVARSAIANVTGMQPPEWSDATSDTSMWAGVIVIGLGLLFSILVLAIETYEAKSKREDLKRAMEQSLEAERNVLGRDFDLYEKFKEQFGTGSQLEYFTCNHNFGSSWRSETSGGLHNFVDTWVAPEMKFIDPELSDCFEVLLSGMSDLSGHLATHAGPLEVNANFHCIFEPSRHNEMDLPAHVDKAITEANRMGVSVRKQREAFIMTAERRFAVLPRST